jgi:outer membrane biosynthesis protein TonB
MVLNPDLKPSLPPAMRKAGMILKALAKICVEKDGKVKSVQLLKATGDATVDENIKSTYMQRKYKPYQVNGNAVPFCHPVMVAFDVR